MIDFEKMARDHYEKASPEERERIDAARLQREEDAKRSRARVRALRSNCITGETKETEIVLVARPGYGEHTKHEIWVYVEEGGPTGYESIPLERIDEAIALNKPWSACHGTEGRWDGLSVPVSSLRIARVVFASELCTATIDHEGATYCCHLKEVDHPRRGAFLQHEAHLPPEVGDGGRRGIGWPTRIRCDAVEEGQHCASDATWSQGPCGFSFCDEHVDRLAEDGDDMSSYDRIEASS